MEFCLGMFVGFIGSILFIRYMIKEIIKELQKTNEKEDDPDDWWKHGRKEDY